MTHPCRPLLRSIVLPRIIGSVLLLGMGFGLGLGPGLGIGSAEAQEPIKHSYLVMGAKTAILGEDGNTTWEYSGGSRDGFVLPNGNVLLAFSNRVEEVTPDKQIAWEFKAEDAPELNITWVSSVQQLKNGNLLVGNFIRGQEGKGAHAFEVTRDKKVVWKWEDHAFIKSLTTVRALGE